MKKSDDKEYPFILTTATILCNILCGIFPDNVHSLIKSTFDSAICYMTEQFCSESPTILEYFKEAVFTSIESNSCPVASRYQTPLSTRNIIFYDNEYYYFTQNVISFISPSGEIREKSQLYIRQGYLHIRREEVLDTPLLPDGSFGPRTFTVVDHTKTNAGLRDIPAIQEVTELVTEVKKANLTRHSTSEYLFIKKDGSKMHAKSVDRKIRTLCTRAGINPRSAHKLRKTFISTLIDAGMNIDTVRRIAGHKDESVTLSNYCFDQALPKLSRTSWKKPSDDPQTRTNSGR